MKYSLNINLDKPGSTGESPIYFVIFSNAKRFKIFSGKKIYKKDWHNDLKIVAKKSQDYKNLVAEIDQLHHELKRELHKLSLDKVPITKQTLLNKISFWGKRSKEDKNDLISYYTDFISTLKNKGSKSIIKNQTSVKNHLQKFCTQYNFLLSFESCDLNFYNSLLNYFINVCKLQNSTIEKNTAMFCTFLNWTVSEGFNQYSHFKKFKAPKKGDKEIYPLSKQDLQLFELYEPETTSLQKVKDLFLLECYTSLRFSDVQNISKEKIVSKIIDAEQQLFINITTQKTTQNLSIPLQNKAIAILEKYAYKMPSISNQKMNDYLKKLAAKVGLNQLVNVTKYSGMERIETKVKRSDLITSHTARHTFVTLSLLAGMDADSIKRITGHRNDKTFQKYIHYNDTHTYNQMNKAWN